MTLCTDGVESLFHASHRGSVDCQPLGRQTIQDTQFSRHTFGDAHGNAFLLAQREEYIPSPQEPCSTKLDLVPGDTERRMADAKWKEY